jgi:hypothetical protein
LHAKDSLCPKVHKDVATAVAKGIASACELGNLYRLKRQSDAANPASRFMLLRGNHQQNIALIHDAYTLVMVLSKEAQALSPAPCAFRRRVPRAIIRLSAHSQRAVDVRSPAVSEPVAAQIHQPIVK